MSMFGALNRFISRLDADPKTQESQTQSAYGFQVLKNTHPEIPLEPWYDFIVGINGHNIDNPDPTLFTTEVRNCAGSSIELGLWSAKGARLRSLWIPVPPSTNPSDAPPSLGLSLHYQPLSTTHSVWHVLDVAPSSPADLAGLLPYSDYIIGSPEGLLSGESGLGELVEDYLNQPLRLYVYNQEYDVSRLVTIEPSKSWGGLGALGCTLGYGALHRIPAPLEEPPQGPGETLFESGRGDEEGTARPSSALEGQGPAGPEEGTPQYLVPAGSQAAPPKAPPTAGTGGRRKGGHHAQRGKGMDMDAYFQEGEAKSREVEGGGSSTKSSTAVAPPPKAKPGGQSAEGEAGAGGTDGTDEEGNTGTEQKGSSEDEASKKEKAEEKADAAG